jgi:hypothetical protein
MSEDRLKEVEKIYKEIAEEDKRLAEDFLSISFVDFERIKESKETK